MQLFPMSTAPRNATWINIWRQRGQWTANRFPTAAHWAEGGGEDQPPFKGWFTDAGCSFSQMDMSNVIGWSPIHVEVASNTPFWLEPYRSLDASGSPEAACSVGWEWMVLRNIGLIRTYGEHR